MPVEIIQWKREITLLERTEVLGRRAYPVRRWSIDPRSTQGVFIYTYSTEGIKMQMKEA